VPATSASLTGALADQSAAAASIQPGQDIGDGALAVAVTMLAALAMSLSVAAVERLIAPVRRRF
jgi:hypothetical protein